MQVMEDPKVQDLLKRHEPPISLDWIQKLTELLNRWECWNIAV